MWVGIRQLKDRDLSRAIRRAQRGEEVVVTDRGVPIVRIVPARSLDASPAIKELAARGVLELRVPLWDELGEPVVPAPGKKSAADYVAEQQR